MKKLITRRMVSGIINIVLGIFLFSIGAFDITNYGQSILGDSLANIGFFGLVQGIIYVSTCKTYPHKWLEIVLGIYVLLDLIRPLIVSFSNNLSNAGVAGVIVLIVYAIGAPWSKKGYPDMPYVQKKSSKNENDQSLEQLTQLKKLLDSGVITKKEFEAKKKQILGL